MFCEKCGIQLGEGMAVCPNCNTPIDDKITVNDVKEVVKEKLESINKSIQKAMDENKILREKEEELARLRQENDALRVANIHAKNALEQGETDSQIQENVQINAMSYIHPTVAPTEYMKMVIEDYNPKYNYNPIGMWGYFGYTIIFSIPIVGLILTLIFAFGAGKNINLRNFARSYFCVDVIVLVLMLMMIASGAMLF